MAQTLSPSEVASVIKSAVTSGLNRPIHVQSQPGTGKSSIPEQVAAELDIGFCLFVASLTTTEELAVPIVVNGKVEFGVNGRMLPLQDYVNGDWVDVGDTPERGILLIDELPQGSTDIQKKMGTLIQARRLHNFRLKPGWTIVTTGNRKSDRAGANRMLSHLTDRITICDMDVSIEDFSNWYRKQPNYSPEGLAFLRFRPELLSKFDPTQDICPSPRSWAEGAFKWVGQVAPTIELAMISGCVGEGAAAEFSGFLRTYRDLPDIQQVIDSPTTYKVPNDTSVKYALASLIGSKMDVENIGALLKYLNRMEPEYEIVAMLDAVNRQSDYDIGATPEFIEWANTKGVAVL